MKRLLRFVTVILMTMTLLMPLLEYFDRWDRAGLSNDSELPVFLIALFIALVLIVATAIARRMFACQSERTETEIAYEFVLFGFVSWTSIVVPPSVSPPLRI